MQHPRQLVAFASFLLVGCAMCPSSEHDAAAPTKGAFALELPNGAHVLVRPQTGKLKQQLGTFAPGPERFEEIVRQRFALACRQDAPVEVADLVFFSMQTITRDGELLPPDELRVGDYADIEEVR